jgi:hypothetical protein
MSQGEAKPAGDLAVRKIVPAATIAELNALYRAGSRPGVELSAADIIRYGAPQRGLPDAVNAWRWANRKNLWRGARRILVARALDVPHMYGMVWLRKLSPWGDEIDLGLASLRVVTTAGVGAIVDAFQDSFEPELFKFHGLGTGSTAEAAGDTGLETELTTQYETDNVRPTGTTAEGASANIYQTVATITVDDAVAATEHGVLSSATVGSGVLLDRSVFAVVNLASSEAIEATYEITFSAGS